MSDAFLARQGSARRRRGRRPATCSKRAHCSSGRERPLRDLHDLEGFAAGAHQFDSDTTSGRHPRAALGTSDDELVARVCDGRRTGIDVGLTLGELAEFMATYVSSALAKKSPFRRDLSVLE